MLQDIIVYLIVAAAAGYLARMVWQSASGTKGCGSCGSGGCAKPAASARQASGAGGLIQINLNSTSHSGHPAARHAAEQGRDGHHKTANPGTVP